MLPLAAGSFVYSPGVDGARGELLMVWHAFHPGEQGRELDENGDLRVSCVELLHVPTKGRRSLRFELDKKQSFANGSSRQSSSHLRD